MTKSIDFFQLLVPEAAPPPPKEDQLKLDKLERIYFELNKRDKCYFRFSTETDLKRIFRPFKDEKGDLPECITKLAKCTKTLDGHVTSTYSVVDKINATFNIHEFVKPILLSQQYLIDLLDFPPNLEGNAAKDAITEFERFIRTHKLIAQKKMLLEKIGYTYFIHYDPVRLINCVILNGK